MDHLSNCTCKSVQVCASTCKYVQVCASVCITITPVMAVVFVHRAFICSDRRSSFRLPHSESHGQNLFAETPMLLSSLACAAQCSCACGSYQRCRAQCVCIRAPTGHRPSVYERIRWGDPPSPSCARCLSESPGVFGLQETLLFGRMS